MKAVNKILGFISVHPLIFFLAATFAVGFEFFFLGPYSFVFLGDTITLYIPRYSMLAEHISNTGVTQWLPNLLMGIDSYTVDVTPWHIGTWLFYALPTEWAYMALVAIILFLSGYFMYKLMNCRLGVAVGPSATTALMYMVYIPLPMAWFSAGLAVLPCALYCFDYVIEKRKRYRHIVAVLLGLLVGFFSPLIITLPYIIVGVVIFFLIRYGLRKMPWLCLVLLIAAAFGLHYNQILTLPYLVAESYRPAITWFFIPTRYISNVVHEIKLYFVPLALGVVAWCFVVKHKLAARDFRKWIGWGLAVFFLTVFVGLIEPHRAPIFQGLVGSLNAFSIGRFIFVLPFFLSIAVGCSLNIFAKDYFVLHKAKQVSLGIVISVIVMVLLIVSNATIKVDGLTRWFVGNHNFAYTRNSEIRELYEKEKEDGALYRVTALSSKGEALEGGLLNLYGFEVLGGHNSLPSAHLQAFWRALDKTGTIPMLYTFAFRGNHAGHIEQLDKLYRTHDINELINLPLLGFANVKYLFSRFPLIGEGLTLVNPEVVSVYEQSHKDSFGGKVKQKFKEVFNSPPAFIYRNEYYIDRFFLTPSVRFFVSSEELVREMASSAPAALQESVFLLKDYQDKAGVLVFEPQKVDDKDGKVALEVYEPERLVFSVELDEPKMLVVTNNYSSGWKAYINGEEVEIIPAYDTFWGVVVNPGVQEVIFKYEPLRKKYE